MVKISKLGRNLENGKLHIPEDKVLPGTNLFVPHVIIRDSAFPLKSNFMRPYPESQASHDV